MFDLKKAVIPLPKKIEEGGKVFPVASFDAEIPVITTEVSGAPVQEGASLIEKRFRELAATDRADGYRITITVNPESEVFADISNEEAYYIDVKEDGAVLCGKDEAGAFYAAVTFCQMVFADGDNICIPEAYILDYPDFKYRGQFMECRYGSEFLSFKDMCDMIDYLAYMKQNQVTIGVYGCWETQYDSRYVQYLYVPIKKYPELKTPKNIKYYSAKEGKYIHKDNLLPTMFEEDFFGELIAYAKRKNVTVKPLFNSLGHNTLIPQTFPEISAKKENGESASGGFCTNNEKTYEIMFDIYDEIIDRYLIPNGVYDIEIGLDEVPKSYVCKCEKCRNSELSEHMVNYIIRVCRHLKEKGMKRIYIYHDMLYHHFNIINEDLKERFIREDIYDVVVIDWWSYEDPKHLFLDNTDGVNNIFHSIMKPDTGYYHWTIPTENNENIHACTSLAKERGFEGVESYSSFEYCYDKNYLTLSDVSWNTETIDKFDEFNERYAHRYYPDSVREAAEAFREMSDIMKDETGEMYMNRICYYFESYFFSYRRNGKVQAFPDGAYKRIFDEEEKYIAYFEYLNLKSKKALSFFENNGVHNHINDIWTLNAKHYFAVSDEYLTIWGMYNDYKDGKCDEQHLMSELERLISQREALMLMAENVRIAPTSYTYLRNMSMFRQFMTDYLDYIRGCVENGEKPNFDVLDTSHIQTERMKFLR